MNKTKNIHNQNQNKSKKLFVASIAIVVALTLFVTPWWLNVDDAFATPTRKIKPHSPLINHKPQIKMLVCFWWNYISIMQQR